MECPCFAFLFVKVCNEYLDENAALQNTVLSWSSNSSLIRFCVWFLLFVGDHRCAIVLEKTTPVMEMYLGPANE